MDNTQGIEGRIWFHGNPWPAGHNIKSFKWTATIHPIPLPSNNDEYQLTLMIGFELETEHYYEADGASKVTTDKSECDWQSKAVWNNYHACSISPSQTSSAPGIIVSDGTVPFSFTRKEYHFSADTLPVNMQAFYEVNAFSIYLLGHDAVANHEIRLHSRTADGSYTLDWIGKIALTYSGTEDFDYNFTASIKGVRFDAIALPYLDPIAAKEYYNIDIDPLLTPRDYIAPFVEDPNHFIFEKRGEVLYALQQD